MIKTWVPNLGRQPAPRMVVRHGLRTMVGRFRRENAKTSVGSSAAQHASHRMDTSVSSLQNLYNLAKSSFSEQPVPSREAVDTLLDAMRAVPLEELGFRTAGEDGGVSSCASEDASGGRERWSPRAITYLRVREEDDLHVGIFCLPANTVIPLHNHPGMTVLSRLLYGKMHLRAYEWNQDGSEGTANLVMDCLLKGSQATSVCFPHEGNIHEFRAITPCAVLDIMSPPYNLDEGRDCTYFTEVFPPWIKESDDGFIKVDDTLLDTAVRLVPCHAPSNFYVEQGSYAGLAVEGSVE